MKKFDMLIAIRLLLGTMAAAQAQQSNELERVQAASRKFVAAVSGRESTLLTRYGHTRAMPRSLAR